MTDRDPKHEHFSDLTNALQQALLMVSRLEPDTRELRRAVERAADAAHQLRRDESGGAR